jgi:hypothetical protein
MSDMAVTLLVLGCWLAFVFVVGWGWMKIIEAGK